MSFDRDALRQALAAHGRVARVVIAEHKGSSPREVGAAMLVWEGGQSGTIGGGALELEAARCALETCQPRVRRVPLGPALGQCCGGAVTLVTEVFERMPDTEDLFIRRVEGSKDAPLSLHRARGATRNGSGAGLVFEDGWLSESVQHSRAPLWVWGAGHVGRAIVGTVAPLDMFEITWVDSALDRFPNTLPPFVQALPAKSMPDAVALAPANAHHLILTYSHAFDLEICHRLLSHRFASAGLIGSATKWARFRSRLSTLGHGGAQILRIRCPIGQPALGKHPQAIAVGVASELVIALQSGAVTANWGRMSRFER